MRRKIFLAVLVILVLLTFLFSEVAQDKRICEWLDNPVDDQTFRTFLDFFAYDKNLPFEVQTLDEKEREGVRREHLSFLSTPDERVFAHLYSVIGTSSKKEPALIFLHGGVALGKDAPYYEVYSELLARGGWRVLSIDLEYFGERSTTLLTTFAEDEKHERLYNNPPTYLAWMTQCVKDISRSIDFLINEKDADQGRIGLVGFSRGAVVAAVAGGAEKRLCAVVLLHGGHFDAKEREHLPAACPANYIGRISPRPLLMINGTRDTDFIKETSVGPLFELAKDPKKIIWLEAGHAAMPEEARTEIMKWLQKYAR